MVYWTYGTSVGTFWIRPVASGTFQLGIDDEALGSYARPEMAADDVYMCATGHFEWDQQGVVDQPMDLSEWTARRA